MVYKAWNKHRPISLEEFIKFEGRVAKADLRLSQLFSLSAGPHLSFEILYFFT